MSLLKSIFEAQGGKVLEQLAGSFNLNPKQAGDAVSQLLPALTGGLKKNISTTDGLGGLMNAVRNGGHARYLDDPSALTKPEAVNDGNGILGHLLGSKEASRQVASEAAAKTGIDVNILKRMLPMVAAMTMGGVSKQAESGGMLGNVMASLGGAADNSSSGVQGMLGKFLDSDNDGSVMDDVMGMAKKFF